MGLSEGYFTHIYSQAQLFYYKDIYILGRYYANNIFLSIFYYQYSTFPLSILYQDNMNITRHSLNGYYIDGDHRACSSTNADQPKLKVAVYRICKQFYVGDSPYTNQNMTS